MSANPIQDPQQLIAYLNRFRSMYLRASSLNGWGSWCENIRADLSAIPDPVVRQEAQDLFVRVQSCSYIHGKTPELYPESFKNSVDALIAYLEANYR